MKSILLASALLFGLGSVAAAADAPVDEVVVVDTAYNWSGVYVGVQAGYGWGNNQYGFTVESSSVDFDSDGFVGGLTVGANWQSGSFVYGVEADVSYADVNGSTLVNATPCLEEGCSADLDWYGTGRVRLGYAINNFLPYVTGGFAVGGVSGTADIGACTNGDPGSCSYDDTEFGWSAGLGVEWGLTQQVSVKAEYLHVDFGTPDFSNIPGAGFASVEELTLDTVRIGLNYRF